MQLDLPNLIVTPGKGLFHCMACGAAGNAMDVLNRHGLVDVLCGLKQPVLGICLGMQLLFESSEEDNAKMLGIIPARLKRLAGHGGLRVPHMGWNNIRIEQSHPLLSGLGADDEFYFVHSYYPDPQAADTVIAVTDYGISFASIVGTNNLFATQFHLEKSGRAGLKILDNFCKWKP